MLVAVERDPVRVGNPLQDCRGAADASEVGGRVTRELELEIPRLVGGDDFLERLGQTVTQASLEVVPGQRIEQADRVAQRDVAPWLQRSQERREVETAQVRRQRRDIDPREVCSHRRVERCSFVPA